nr:MAG TPA: hypothetical protein [Caudoviricetes sp.]
MVLTSIVPFLRTNGARGKNYERYKMGVRAKPSTTPILFPA